jgi:hypothetical protein
VEGYRPRPFGLRGGFTIPPGLRFPRPPYNAGRPDFPWSGLKPWHFIHEPSPSSRGSSAGAHTPRRRLVCSWLRPWPWLRLICSVLSSRTRACRRNHQVPRVPLPDVGVTSIRETCPASSEDITPRSSLLQTHSSIPCGSPRLRPLASFVESLQVAASPCCYRDSPDVISANPSPDAWSRTPAGPTECIYLFLPLCHRPSPCRNWVGFLLCSANTTFRGMFFEVADISLCSGLRVCSPPRSFPPLCSSHRAAEAFTFGLNVLRCLRTHRIC